MKEAILKQELRYSNSYNDFLLSIVPELLKIQVFHYLYVILNNPHSMFVTPTFGDDDNIPISIAKMCIE